MSDAPAKPRRHKWPARLALALLALFVVLAAGYLVISANVESRWQKFVQEMKHRGEPLTFAEIEAARTPLPDEQNNALIVQTFLDMELVSIEHSYEVQTKADFDGVTREQLAYFQEFVDKNAAAAAALERLHSQPVGRFNMDVEADIVADKLLPKFGNVRSRSKFAHAQAVLALSQGDTEAAADQVLLTFQLSGALNEFPTLVSRLVQIAMEALAVTGIEFTLGTGSLTPETISTLREKVQWHEQHSSLVWALRGERAWQLEVMTTGVQWSQNATGWQRWAFWQGPYFAMNRNKSGVLLSKLIDASEDHRELLRRAREMETEVFNLSFLHGLSKTFLPSLSRACELSVQHVARLRVTDAALAAEQFRMAHDRFPESLDELVPEYLEAIPQDPFAGEPIRLAGTDFGLVIYSVGLNETDDGGNLARSAKVAGPTDVGFRLRHPELREFKIIEDEDTDDQ